ncbi:MAG: acetylxylan esterase [Verrucomicrobia subdivision 3 bacterium]|nr:acetylxylan esterase [Limisphaerales bacterium]
MKKFFLSPRIGAIVLCVFQFTILQSVWAALLNTPGDKIFAAYFKHQTDQIASRSLSKIKTIEDWNAQKKTYRQQMHEMLGLDPMPPRTPLKATVTGKLHHKEFEIWKVHFQSKPGLYVTANLYVPNGIKDPAPTILYVCGHGRVKKNGVSYGNKVHYQHHGVWFARNGFVCLVIDTLQLGEIEGIHHGTYNHDMWWWNSRGYSSAAVEAWNCIRALDYLETLNFVDKNRFGVTGRSGGGAYSWWVSVLDERIKASAPVAGIADLKNHVYAGFPNSGRLAHGVVEGHCDCMFHVNTFRWDFPQVAALVAPRPLLILNTDDDRIFPLDGVTRVFNGARKIYDLHGARDKLGLVIIPGGHSDTQPLRVPAFNWFNKHLKGKESPITITAEKLFEPEQLRVFKKLPADEINTKIQDSFIGVASGKERLKPDKALAQLRAKTFRGWPSESGNLNLKKAFDLNHKGVRFAAYDFDSQDKIRLRMYVAHHAGLKNLSTVHVEVLGEENWRNYLKLGRPAFAGVWAEELKLAGIKADAPVTAKMGQALEQQLNHIRKQSEVVYITFMPRGVGLTTLSADERHITQTRRRFMLLGQTLAGMQVWDVRRCLQAVQALPGFERSRTELWGKGNMASVVTLASLYEPFIGRLNLSEYPKDDKVQPDYLNISRIATPKQILGLAALRSSVHLLDKKK